MNLCITEYDEERILAELKEDARRDGRKEGFEKGKIKTALNLLALGTISKEDIVKSN